MLRRAISKEACKSCAAKKVGGGFFTTCDNCVATVVQTKIGACIQLVWCRDFYCSIDLVPAFNVPTMHPLDLAKIVNRGMLEHPRPVNWHR